MWGGLALAPRCSPSRLNEWTSPSGLADKLKTSSRWSDGPFSCWSWQSNRVTCKQSKKLTENMAPGHLGSWCFTHSLSFCGPVQVDTAAGNSFSKRKANETGQDVPPVYSTMVTKERTLVLYSTKRFFFYYAVNSLWHNPPIRVLCFIVKKFLFTHWFLLGLKFFMLYSLLTPKQIH